MSAGYPNQYGNIEGCTIEFSGLHHVRVEAFETETFYDVLSVDGLDYSGDASVIPEYFDVNQQITWRTDFTSTQTGWRICFQATTTTTTLPSGACAPPLGVHDVDTSSCSGVLLYS